MVKKMTTAGFSLVEIMIALGLLGAVSMGVLELTKMMNQNSTKFNVDSDTTLITNELVAILSNPVHCLATFSGKNAVNTASGVVNYIKVNAEHRYATNAPTGNSGVKINAYSLSDSDPDVDVPSNTTNLIIHFARKKAQVGSGDIIKKIKLYVEVNGTGLITNCRSLSSSSTDIWSRGNGGDIYYSGGNVGIRTTAPTATLTVVGTASISGQTYFGGNVGIGTMTPQAKLDVAGEIRPGSSGVSVGGSCLYEGAFAYDLSAHVPVYCNNDSPTKHWAMMGQSLDYGNTPAMTLTKASNVLIWSSYFSCVDVETKLLLA